MNDREIIEHWALREALTLWLVAALACGVMTLSAAAAALFFVGGWLWLAAAAGTALTCICIWRMRRISARLDHLEQFV